MKILALDPSLTCTGWAVLTDDASRYGRLEHAGRIDGDSGVNLVVRVHSLVAEVGALVLEYKPDTVYVETPANKGVPWGGFANRNPMHIPIYGMGVAAALIGAGRKAIGVPADLWTTCGLIPATRKDPHKVRRVREAAAMYGRKMEDFGPVSVAGNVADAVLLGFWALRVNKAPVVDGQLRLGAA